MPSQHTPGPWELFLKPATRTISIGAKGLTDFVVSWQGFDSCGATWRQRVANARLIAVAPEMLAALRAQELVDDHVAECEDCSDGAFPELCPEGFPFADDARLLRRAVLAKAEGRTNA